MPFTNITTITEFILRGFPGLQPTYYGPVGLLLLFVYLAILTGNSLILTLVATERSLQKPMYLIFCNLAVSDMIFGTTTLPKAIARYWAEDKTISFTSCFLQMFIVHLVGGFNSLTLMIMAIDRFVAICNPIRYHSLIKNSTIVALSGMSGSIALVRVITLLVISISLPYCNSNEILHCFCDQLGVTSLACERVREVQNIGFALVMCFFLGPLTFIIFSYVSIIVSVMKITGFERKCKMFSTCRPQILIICLYYIPRCFNYIANYLNFKFSADSRIAMIMLYSLFPPMVNPFIYCLRTKEVREVLVRRLKFRKVGMLADHT